jgi:DNA-binding NarL/FixJ family response regulator
MASAALTLAGTEPAIEIARVENDSDNSEITRVLICGDQPLYRSALSSLIERNNGFRRAAESTTRVEDVEQALATDVQMVLIDFDLLPQDGHDLPALERLLDVVAPRPVVIVCSGLDSEECQTVLRHGISGVVAKSSGGDVLCDALDSARRGQVWLDRALLTDALDDSQARRRARSEAAKIEQLTPREREIFQVACTGVTNKQIAEQLSISEATVRHHLGSIFAKLGVSTRSELVVYGYRYKLAGPVSE